MTVAPTSVQPGGEPHQTRWVLLAIGAFLLGGLAVGLLFQFDVLGSSSSTNTPSASTTEGSGVPSTQVREVPTFHAVELAGSSNVVIRAGEKQSVVVRADDNLLDRVTTEVKAGTLVLGTTPGSMTTKSPMSVEIGVPELTSLTLNGSGNIVVTNVSTDRLDVSLPGSGTLTADGTATKLDLSVGGSGSVQFARLVAKDAHVGVSGSGAAFVTATRSLTASVSGTGAIIYTGNPQSVTKNVTGSGAVTGS
jgi:hypothetical protein